MAALLAVQWSEGVESAWSSVAEFVPRLAAFLAILIIGAFVAKALAAALDKVLDRVGFDRAVERGGIRKALSHSQYDASDLLSKVVYYGLMLFVLQAAFGVFGPNPISDLLGSVIAYLPAVFAAIVIVVVASAIAAAVREIIDASLGGLSYGKALANAASAFIMGIGLFAALSQLNIAPAITNGLFYGILASIVGVTVIAVGGGGIKPMQQYWEQSLSRISEESSNVRKQAAGAGDRITQRAEERADQARSAAQGGSATGASSTQVTGIDVRETPATAQSWQAGGATSESGRNPQGF